MSQLHCTPFMHQGRTLPTPMPRRHSRPRFTHRLCRSYTSAHSSPAVHETPVVGKYRVLVKKVNCTRSSDPKCVMSCLTACPCDVRRVRRVALP